MHNYRSRRDPRTALRTRLRKLAQVRIHYGYRRLQVLLRREGWSAGKNLIYRLHTEEGRTYRETGEVLMDLAKWADLLGDPLTVREKLSQPGVEQGVGADRDR